MSTVEEIEKRRADRKAAAEAPRLEQLATDLEALDALEIEHGDGKLVRVELGFFQPGLPTFVLARMAKPVEFKRYQDMANKKHDGAGLQAQNMLTDSCQVYPDGDTYKLVRNAVPGIHANLGNELVKLSIGRSAEEGKG